MDNSTFFIAVLNLILVWAVIGIVVYRICFHKKSVDDEEVEMRAQAKLLAQRQASARKGAATKATKKGRKTSP